MKEKTEQFVRDLLTMADLLEQKPERGILSWCIRCGEVAQRIMPVLKHSMEKSEGMSKENEEKSS